MNDGTKSGIRNMSRAHWLDFAVEHLRGSRNVVDASEQGERRRHRCTRCGGKFKAVMGSVRTCPLNKCGGALQVID